MIRDSLLPELDLELATTRRVLERVSEYKLAWKPHDKSFTLGALSSHLANLCQWGLYTLQGDSFDLAPGGVPVTQNLAADTIDELLARFDASSSALRAALAEASDERLLGPWSLLHNGRATMTMPRVAVLRSFVINHIIHHRGQLTVYLRLTGSTVPSVYGPSADEPR